jgi:hypothetical protein
MKSTFSIFVATTLLLASSTAEAAHGTAAGNSNLILSPPPPITTAPPQTNPIGGVNQSVGIAPGLPEIDPITGQNFGALPGNPGSPTYDPNAALPSLNNAGSALSPLGATGTASPSGTSTP